MNSLNSGPCARTRQRLFKQARLADYTLMETHRQAPETMITQLIGTELEPGEVKRAREHLLAVGLDDLVQVREGDARETLKDLGGGIHLVLLDGAFSLYLPVHKLREPDLRDGALILAENAFEQAGGYLAYVRDSANGYLSQPVVLNEGRGNELTVRVRG